MRHFVQLISALTAVGVHRHMFCSALKFDTWYELLVREQENVVKPEDVLESEVPATQTTTVLEVEAKVLNYVRLPWVYIGYPIMKQL